MAFCLLKKNQILLLFCFVSDVSSTYIRACLVYLILEYVLQNEERKSLNKFFKLSDSKVELLIG